MENTKQSSNESSRIEAEVFQYLLELFLSGQIYLTNRGSVAGITPTDWITNYEKISSERDKWFELIDKADAVCKNSPLMKAIS